MTLKHDGPSYPSPARLRVAAVCRTQLDNSNRPELFEANNGDVPFMVDDKKLQDSIDRSEIINLVSKSIITRDSGLWEKLAECLPRRRRIHIILVAGKALGLYQGRKQEARSRASGGRRTKAYDQQSLDRS